jgi:transcriptional regulator with XRE-family HTH domain
MDEGNNLKALLRDRGISQEAAGMLGGVHATTISKICSGQVRARPATIVRLARGLGVGARRMQAMCDAHYLEAHPDEILSGTSAASA